MSLDGLVWFWFALAISCVLAGLALTGQRVNTRSSPRRATQAIRRASLARNAKKGGICSRCAQEVEPDAYFCGGCGLDLQYQQQVRQKEARKV